MRTKTPHKPYTTLGIAASSSTRKPRAAEPPRGELREKNCHAERERHGDQDREERGQQRADDHRAAPYSSATGSHVEVQRNEGRTGAAPGAR